MDRDTSKKISNVTFVDSDDACGGIEITSSLLAQRLLWDNSNLFQRVALMEQKEIFLELSK